MKIPDSIYGVQEDMIKTFVSKLSECNVNVKIKAIQIGREITRYIFKIVSSQAHVNRTQICANDIRLCLATQSIANLTITDDKQQCLVVDVKHDCRLEPQCKKALRFWLRHCRGIAIDDSYRFVVGRSPIKDWRELKRMERQSRAQVRLEIHYFHLGRIINQLWRLGCLSCIGQYTYKVTIYKRDLHALFPKNLGWRNH